LLSKRYGVLFYILALGALSNFLAGGSIFGILLLIVSFILMVVEVWQLHRILTQAEVWICSIRAFLIALGVACLVPIRMYVLCVYLVCEFVVLAIDFKRLSV